MEVKELEKYFSDTILRRGYDYYKNDYVININKFDNIYIAIVKGTENYEVLVNLDIDPYQMNCSCPYAASNNCKHMAAVLYCLKNGEMPITEVKEIRVSEELSDFEKLKKEFNQEYYSLSKGKTYLNLSQLEKYIKLINKYAKYGGKHIKSGPELAYQIMEFLILNVNNTNININYNDYDYDEEYDYHDIYYTVEEDKKELLEVIVNNFKELLENKVMLLKTLKFIEKIYTVKTDKFNFEFRGKVLKSLYDSITFDCQAKLFVDFFSEMSENEKVSRYEREGFIANKIILIYKFIDRDVALSEAERSLDLEEMRKLLLNEYENNLDKQIDILNKIIIANEGWRSEKYVEQLLEIYKKHDKQKYIELLKSNFIKYGNIDKYLKIKKYYKTDWDSVKEEYLHYVLNNHDLYRNICIEEGYYDKLLTSLEDETISTIDVYTIILTKHAPTETLVLYKKALLEEVKNSKNRKAYQNFLRYLKTLLYMDDGEEAVLEIIKYARDNHKNRRAMQEELDFFEATYL